MLNNSFFVFGARGTGKSTLVRSVLSKQSHAPFVIDLLHPDDDERYGQRPEALIGDVRAKAKTLKWVIIDEVQRRPKLLDVVHLLMEAKATKHIRFALTGSSARKLKVAGANLLAGRAFINELYPFTHIELGKRFDLDAALNWGTLPKLLEFRDDASRQEYLRAYTRAYLKEEVWDERLVHNLDPFRKFVEVAAQASGTILNFSNVARDTGVDDKTVKKYFEILADTFLGFYLEAYHRSVRAQQVKSPKFYLFDLGAKRAMEGLITAPVVPGTYAYGRAFEHFVISECIRLNSYRRLDCKFSYLKTKTDLEIDLIIERPRKPAVVVEIKSGTKVDDRDVAVIRKFRDDFPKGDFQLWSNDERTQDLGGVKALHWKEGIAGVLGD